MNIASVVDGGHNLLTLKPGVDFSVFTSLRFSLQIFSSRCAYQLSVYRVISQMVNEDVSAHCVVAGALLRLREFSPLLEASCKALDM